MTTTLSNFNNSWYKPGSSFKRLLWLVTSAVFFQHHLALGSGWKCILLRVFGAKIGRNIVIKPSVTIKYPWFLSIEDHTWIGEQVWIDNLAMVKIGKNCCVSQGAMLLTGNHNYSRSSFDLILGTITLEDGVWIGAKSIVCPGVTCYSHSLLTVGSVASNSLNSFGIYKGNPAVMIKKRVIEN